MTEDPFDALEDRLRSGVARRRRRWSVVRRGPALGAVAVLVGAGGTGVAIAQLGSGGQRGQVINPVSAALFEGGQVAGRDPSCQPARGPQAARFVPGGLPRLYTDQLAVMRRRQRASDLRATARRFGFPGEQVLRDSVRIARASNGDRFVLAATRDSGSLMPKRDARRCAEVSRAAALQRAERYGPTTLHRVRRLLDREDALRRRNALPTTFGLTMLEYRGRGRTGSGGGSLLVGGRIPASGSFGWVGRPDRPKRLALTGLVPDGIASVRLRDRVPGIGGRRAPSQVVRVRDNVYSVVLRPRLGPKVTVEWRDARGSVVRTTHTGG